jgi:hypothetical protein
MQGKQVLSENRGSGGMLNVSLKVVVPGIYSGEILRGSTLIYQQKIDVQNN